jgi:alpha-1,4-digalacturonate transport system permease protein
VSIWAHMGFYTLILLAGLQAIPKDMYEAAEMDAASPWRTLRRITLPLLMPNLIVVLVLALIRAVQIFDEVFVLTGGGPGSATTFIVQFIYQTGFAEQIHLYGLAAAASLMLALGLMALTVMQLKLTRASQAGQKAQVTPWHPVTFLTRTRGRLRLDWTDWLSYLYLLVGLFTMFAPSCGW